jgi:hypothetical protein
MVDMKALSRKKDKSMFTQKETVSDQRIVGRDGEWLMDSGKGLMIKTGYW